MARVLAIDYGKRRCGLAISDPLGMIANGLDTADTETILERLSELQDEYAFETIVIGLPLRWSGEASEVESDIQSFIKKLVQRWPKVKIERFDERFTSKIAAQVLVDAGATKKQRKTKGNIDKVSASLILQEYLNSK